MSIEKLINFSNKNCIGTAFVITLQYKERKYHTNLIYKHNKMKNSIVIVIMFLVSNVVFSQTVFDKYDGQDGVTSIIVNKKMFQMMASVKVDANDKETQQYIALLKKLDDLKVFTTSNSKIATDMLQTADTYSKNTGLEELMRINKSGQNLRVLVKAAANESQIKELLMYSEEPSKVNETVLMTLKGDFNINEVSVLIEKMKISGGEEFKKASNKVK